MLLCKWSYWVTYPVTNVTSGTDPALRTPQKMLSKMRAFFVFNYYLLV